MLNSRLTVSRITLSRYVNASATQHKSTAYLPFCSILTAESRCQSAKTEVHIGPDSAGGGLVPETVCSEGHGCDSGGPVAVTAVVRRHQRSRMHAHIIA
jgi:hypothetical protein